MHPRCRRTTLAMLAALLLPALLVAVGAAPAQDADQAGKQEEAAQDEKLIDVQFAGGTVADYIAALRKADATANVVLIPPASEVALPRIELRRSSVHAAVYLLDDLVWQHQRGPAALHVANVGIRYSGERQIYTVTAKVLPTDTTPAAGTHNAPIETRVWSIADLLDNDLKAEHVLSAIEAGLDLVKDEHPPAQLRYHADTALIIASGHPAQIAVIHEITHSLWETRQRQREREAPHEQWRDAIKQREDLIQQLRQELVSLQSERDELRRVNQRFEVEVHQLQLEIGNLHDRLSQADHELSQLKSQRDRQP